MTQLDREQSAVAEIAGRRGDRFYTVGGIGMLSAAMVALTEIAITLVPQGAPFSPQNATVMEWFALFQNHWFLGLRNLGLLNLVGAALLAPAIISITFVLGRANPAGMLGSAIFFTGIAVYIAGDRAFAMLSLSGQYAAAANDAQRSLLAATGQAMLTEGSSRAGLVLVEFACLMLSAAMLGSHCFGRATAYAGILGNGLLIIFEGFRAFTPAIMNVSLAIAVAGGLALIAWYLLAGAKLLQQSSEERAL